MIQKEFCLKREKFIFICERVTEFCIYLIIFTLTFSKAAVEIFFIFAFLPYLIKKALSYSKDRYNKRWPSTNLDIPLLAFILANIISVALSHNFILSLRAFIGRLSENIILYLMVLEIILFQKKDKSKFFVNAIILTAVAIMIDAIFQYFVGWDIYRHFIREGPRLKASFGSPNSFGAWLIMIIPLICCWGIMGEIKNLILRRGLYILIGLLIFCLFFTYSRAAWLGLICGFLFIGFFRDLRMILFLLILIAIFSSIILFYPASMAWFQTQYAKYAVEIRLNLWDESIAMIKDYPVFGVGLKNYLEVVPKYQIDKFNLPISQIGESTGLTPHNCYLQMTAETGLVGLVCFLWIIWTLFSNGISLLRKKMDPILLGLLSGLLAFLVSIFFDNHLNKIELSAMFWIMVALTAGLVKKQDKDEIK